MIDAQTALAALTGEFFAAVSFEPGQQPAYHRLAGLFLGAGLLIRCGETDPEVSTVEQFVAARRGPVASAELAWFTEYELAAQTDVFGAVAHRLSTYGKRGVRGGAAFAARGLISTQFAATTDGWRITSMAWDDERPGLSLPDRYTGAP